MVRGETYAAIRVTDTVIEGFVHGLALADAATCSIARCGVRRCRIAVALNGRWVTLVAGNGRPC
jgi:hypothetical protein